MSDKTKRDQRDKETKETNIQVCLRCRPKSTREATEAPVIECFTERREIHVATNATDKNSSKAFTFDRVFGPETAQAQIYQEVVQPLIEEVIMGYNCTIFAYGQTGTGKTYTMEGSNWDDDETSMEDNAGAGIIPRALYNLFQILDQQTSEYTVRISHVELYNEELKDLLSSEDDFQKLRIFDDPKGGSALHGVVEDLVKNAADVIKVMQKGTSKRKVAATSLNQNSSRSHSVFSITVHIKESTPEGEDLLKVGKLNLVDLAGSENIRRSGAENIRAREAGKINQSLLTLGRVINALVERSPHVPYRESKLTRLLQDSLGGKTKTCIIATISPAKGSLEETLSTLDYAYRAKNIRNRPEVNQRMTKKALIQEYISEIDRLRRDLMASQAKNGIFLDPENFQEIQDLIKSQKEHLEFKIQELQALEGKFDITRKDLENAAKELRQTKGALEKTTQSLVETEKVLQQKSQKLVEQETITTEHVETEEHLATVATSLLTTVNTTVSDIEGLHAKLECKRKIEEANMDTLKRFREEMYMKTGAMETHVTEFQQTQGQLFADVIGSMKAFNEAKTKDIENSQKLLQDLSQKVASSLAATTGQIDYHLHSHRETYSNLAGINTKIQDKVHQDSNAWQASIVSTFAALDAQFEQHKNQLEAWQQQLDDKMVQFFELAQTFGDGHKTKLRSINSLVQEEAAKQNQTLELQRESAKKAHQTQQQEAEAMKAQLLADFSQILNTRMASLQRTAQASYQTLDSTLSSNIQYTANTAATLQGRLQDTVEHVDQYVSQTKSLSDEARELATVQSHSEAASSLTARVSTFGTAETEKVRHMTAFVESGVSTSTSILQNAEAAISPFRVTLKESFTALQNSTAAQVGQATASLDAMNSSFSQTAIGVCEGLQVGNTTLSTFEKSERSDLQGIQSRISRLVDQQVQVDESTNKTPKKRSFEYPKSWRRTRNHDDIIQSLRYSSHENTPNSDTASDDLDDDDDSMDVTPTPSVPSATPFPISTASTPAVREEQDLENSISKEGLKKSFLPVSSKATGIPRPVLSAKNT